MGVVTWDICVLKGWASYAQGCRNALLGGVILAGGSALRRASMSLADYARCCRDSLAILTDRCCLRLLL